jgi:hypothetical protein
MMTWLHSTTVASFFERSLKYIKEGLERALRASHFQAKVETLFPVGRFSFLKMHA